MNHIVLLVSMLFLLLLSPNTDIKKMRLGGNDRVDYKDGDCFGCGDCSIYCSIENGYNIVTSSDLSSKGTYSYNASNIDDYKLQTAWIEGKKGNGIGEWIEFRFDKVDFSTSKAKINGLYLYNGYRRSLKAWNENSRVRKMKMSVNGNDFLILELHNSVNHQSINFPEIELSQIQNIRFTIIEVYAGTKFEDTAISEIKFNGIDHH